MQNYDIDLETPVFYKKQVLNFVNDQLYYSQYLTSFFENLEPAKTEIILEDFIEFVISRILYEEIIDADFERLLNTNKEYFAKFGMLFPLEVMLQKANCLEITFKDYLDEVEQDISDIDGDIVYTYAYEYLSETDGLYTFIENMKNEVLPECINDNAFMKVFQKLIEEKMTQK